MKTTIEYFNMSKEDLGKINNEYGYTKEERKILDEGLKVSFYDNINSYTLYNKENSDWQKKNFDLEVSNTLILTDNRIAVIYN